MLGIVKRRSLVSSGLSGLIKAASMKYAPHLLALLFVIVAGCSGDNNITEPDPEPEPVVCTESFQPKTSLHHVVGFYPSWKHGTLPVGQIRWDKLTRIVYAFAAPRANGSLNTAELTQVDALVQAAHAQGVEVYLSVGGGGSGSDEFPAMAANVEARQAFVRGVRDYLGAHCIDGVDIDWERWTKDGSGQPDAAEKANLVLLLQELRLALDPFGLKISIDVYASNWYGQHYDNAIHSLVDYVQVMGYDFTGPWSDPGPHASYDDTIGSGSSVSSTGLAYWTNFRQWPREKILLGVPFFGRDFDTNGGAGIGYRDIVAQHAEAPTQDQVANIYYNGVQTIRDKTQFVVDNNYPGIMIWELSHDTRDDATSLLHTIDLLANP